MQPHSRWVCVAVLGATLIASPATWAQQIPERDAREAANPRALARAKRAAARSRLRELHESRVEDESLAFQMRMEELAAGRGTLDITIEVARRLAEAEVTAATTSEQRGTAYERQWTIASLLKTINDFRYQAGRIAVQDMLQSTHFHIEAQNDLLASRARGERPLSPVRLTFDPDLSQSREFARAKRRAFRGDAAELTVARADVAAAMCLARFKEFLAGRGTQDILLEASRQTLEAELALAKTPAERQASWERQWERVFYIATLDHSRFDAGRIAIQDEAQATRELLDAGVGLAQASPGQSRLGYGTAMAFRRLAAAGVTGEFSPGIQAPLRAPGERPIDGKELARAKRQTSQARLDDILRRRLEPAQTEYRARHAEVLAGRGTLDILFEAALNLWRAEQAEGSERGSVAALERYWQRLWEAEVINEVLKDQGRIPLKMWLENRSLRKQAEIWWAEARQMSARARP